MKIKTASVLACVLLAGCGGSSTGPGTSSWALAGLEKKGESPTEAHCAVSQIEANMPKDEIPWALEVVVLGSGARLPEHLEGKTMQIEELQEIGKNCVK